MTRTQVTTALAATAAALALASCSSAPTPAQRVHTQMVALGHKPHTIYQSRAAIASAKMECGLLQAGHSYTSVVADGTAAFNSRAKAQAFTNTAIAAYCPRFTSAEHGHG